MSKKKILLILTLSAAFMLAGCSGPAWDAMKEEGRKLQQQGQELNQQLESEANEVNSSWMKNSSSTNK